MAHFGLFQIRNFRFLFLARLLLSVAGQIQSVAIGWQIYEIKRDPLYLGLIGLAEVIPAIGVALYAGYLVDRRHPLRIYIRASLICFAGAFVLALVSNSEIGAPDRFRVLALFAVVFLTGIARGFIEPAQFTLFAQSLSREQLKFGAPWMSTAWQVATITGPAMGGLTYAVGGPCITYAIVAIVILAAVGFQGFMQLSTVSTPPPEESLWESLSSGVKFVFSHEIILAALSLDMFAVFFGGATSILPMYVDQVLHQGPAALGLLRAAPSIGALLMAGYLIFHPLRRNAGKLLLWAVAGFGLCMIGFGLSKSLTLSVGLLALSGALDNISVMVRQIILQLSSPPEMRGRISAVNGNFLGSSNELGEFESGVAARLLGLVPSIIFGGCATLLIVGMSAWLVPKLRELDLTALEETSAPAS